MLKVFGVKGKKINKHTNKVSREMSNRKEHGLLRISSDVFAYQIVRFDQMQHFGGNFCFGKTISQGGKEKQTKKDLKLYFS